MAKIRVLLADDHNVVREGLKLLLNAQPDMQVIWEATTGQEAIAGAHQTCPDVAVLDVAMPEIDGLEAAQAIHEKCPQTRILILSMHESDAYFFRALDVGAVGYILKKAASEELIHAVRIVHSGEAYFHSALARKLLDSYRGRTHQESVAGPPGYQDLSDREREILLLIVSGLTNQEIGDKLFITASTVQTHRTNVMAKLEVKNTVELVRYAIRHGLIEA